MNLVALTPDVVRFLAILTVAGQIIIAAAFAGFVVDAATGRHHRMLSWVSDHALGLMLTVALTATLGSLFFSDIAGWTPCKDCWYQRICMYPQVVLLLIACFRKDRNIAPYLLILSLIGAGIAIDHYSEQLHAALTPVDPLVPCDTSGVSCAATQIKFTFGYITIPMMALTAFTLNAIGSVLLLRGSRNRV